MWRAAVICGFWAIATSAGAQDIGDPVAGRALARQVCAACHPVLPGDTLRPNADAPSFQSIAQMPGMTALRLKVALRNVHDKMPDLVLTARETDDVVAYILSLPAAK
jgi:mono/diheme cytochrome c family protein